MKNTKFPTNLKKLMHLLQDNAYHSGTDLGDTLGLSRSGIWKLVKQLEALGLNLESSTNKGYRLLTRLELLDKRKIKKHLHKINLANIPHFFIFDTISSTNDYLINQHKQHLQGNAVCFAEQQSAGRGRLGRHWVSPFAANIYLSLCWRFSCDISELAGLNIVAGVSAVKAIQQVTNDMSIKLKWPNDLFCQNKKLGGILIDVLAEYNGHCSAVIGIGINVDMPTAIGNHIQKPWTNLQTMSNLLLSRNQLAGYLLNCLIENIILFQENKLYTFIEQWNKLDYLYGKPTQVQSMQGSIEGIAQGINPQGHLMLKDQSQQEITITVGDASIIVR